MPTKNRSPRKPARPTLPLLVHALADFDQLARRLGGADAVRDLLGGKGANLAEMASLGLPVPPGFAVTTAACREFLRHGERAPAGLWTAVERELAALERRTGKRLGDPQRPLLLSVRSGARISMPGMMDTVLNLGVTEAVAEALAKATGDERFALDARRRFLQMFGKVVLGAPEAAFEDVLRAARGRRGCADDAGLQAENLREVVARFDAIVAEQGKAKLPADPRAQLRLCVEAVFRSWNGKRARDYRNAAGIPHDLGTAVNVQAMVFGNLGPTSATGVATTRNVTDGSDAIEGDFLVQAQGEDVVSGTRPTQPVAAMAKWQPQLWRQFERHCATLERHYRDVQDVEFTVERGVLWMLQTRTAKRTAQAAVRLAVDFADERRIRRDEALLRVQPEHVDRFLHPQLDDGPRDAARKAGRLLGKGLDVSPGAAVGVAAFDADAAERMAKAGAKVVLVRAETRPDDVHGLLAAEGVVTSRGGRTSHAALVARQFGKPAVVGASSLAIDEAAKTLTGAGGVVVREGEWLSIDGGSGEVFAGKLATKAPGLDDGKLRRLLGWADAARRLGVQANADLAPDAALARSFGAEGIGLCRTEHMFFAPDRLPLVRRLILAGDDAERIECLERLLPMQRGDFLALFRAMDGLPVTIRLLDPPLHEFLPEHDALLQEATTLATRLELRAGDLPAQQDRLAEVRKVLAKVDELREQNPMLGLRGVRLGIHMPAIVRMQVRAICEAACDAAEAGLRPRPKIMIPLASTSAELQVERAELDAQAQATLRARGRPRLAYAFGTMVETPRAALVAGRLAAHAEFFSFGTNDLTQTTFGISRDDAATGFLREYLQQGVLRSDPFATIDRDGVGELMRMAIARGRAARPGLEVGICGEHGGEPRSIAFCDEIGVDYVSCSPYRVPVARLAAAQATLRRQAAARGPQRQK